MTVPVGRDRLSGRNLQKSIIPLARLKGWRIAHFPPVKTDRGWRVGVAADAKGWPDLVLVRDRLIVVEIKGDGDSMRPDQSEWLAAFRMAGVECHIWRPRDWLNGEIEEILSRRLVTSEGLSWARGMWEAKGQTITRPNRRTRLQLNHHDRDALGRFANAVGGGRVYGPYGPYEGKSYAPFFLWVAQRPVDVENVLARLGPRLLV